MTGGKAEMAAVGWGSGAWSSSGGACTGVTVAVTVETLSAVAGATQAGAMAVGGISTGAEAEERRLKRCA